MGKVLEGITVLDCGLLVQGPQAAATLADMGADVIKVELPELGEHARWVQCGPDDPRSAYYAACNRGKRGVTINLAHPAGGGVFRRLAAGADVVVSNFKPGTMDAWGLGYDALSAGNPGLVWAAGSAFGARGPDASREGADLAGQAAGGLISTAGRDGDDPTPVGVTIADHIASQNLVAGILAALLVRARTGRGQKVEVSLLGGQIWAQAPEYTHYLMTGRLPGRANYGHPLIHALYRIYRTADGWLGIIGIPPASRDAFFVVVDRPELAADPRFAQPLVAPEDIAWLKRELEETFRLRSTAQWCSTLGEVGVRYAPVRDYRQVVEDPGAWENGYFQTVDGVRVVGTAIAMSETPLRPGAPAPSLGCDTEAVLAEHGFSSEDIADLRAAGAI